MFCNTCGKELNDRAVVCPFCGVATNGNQNFNVNTANQQIAPWNGGLVFLWFLITVFIPLFGFIMGGVNLKHASRKGVALGLIIVGAVMTFINLILILG